MLPDEVETGQTYRVHISNRDNPAHLLACAPERSEANLVLFTETLDATVHFAELAERNIEHSELTVVETGQVVTLPSGQTLTVPVRWLSPLP
jgi:hypothetical protein